MAFNPRPLQQQVIFITGASSGIGLATVKQAVAQGSKVFMVARNEKELDAIQNEMRSHVYETAYAVADVAEFDQLDLAADQCIRTFGRIDTWVNNAGVTIYSKVLDTTEEEAKRLFDTNFWGMINGCKIAVPLMRERGGTIINIGSVLAKSVDPLQGIYTASEHAMKGFTDALRKELQGEKAPIALSLVIPGSVDTPFLEHARKTTGAAPLMPPISTPEDVAEVILKCAIKPVNEANVGAASFMAPLVNKISPFFMKKVMLAPAVGNLFVASDKEGETTGHLKKRLNLPGQSTIVAGALTVVGGTLVLFRKMRII